MTEREELECNADSKVLETATQRRPGGNQFSITVHSNLTRPCSNPPTFKLIQGQCRFSEKHILSTLPQLKAVDGQFRPYLCMDGSLRPDFSLHTLGLLGQVVCGDCPSTPQGSSMFFM